ncbi:MAG: L-threonylcarbamoyladenylate synthase [Desulfurivibrio sp.]|nr:L-threonylcarbamoyladenylate synthase [Desulfurivibrio sp.]
MVDDGQAAGAEGRPSAALLTKAAAVIAAGGVVAFPTETYYGLAVDPFNAAALQRLFTVKQRPDDKPILTLVAERQMLSRLVSRVPAPYEGLMDAFWPGPLTLIFAARPELPPDLTAHSGTVGVRISSHPTARALAAACGGPITATSANLSGRPAAVSAAEVAAQFTAGIDLILDGGSTPGGVGSTLVGLVNDELQVLREGVVPGWRLTAHREKKDGGFAVGQGFCPGAGGG